MSLLTFLKGSTAYEWQIGPLYGRFTMLRFWWRVPRLDGSRKTFWQEAMGINWDREWNT